MLPIAKLQSLAARFRELDEMLYRPDIASDAERFRKLSRERAELEDLARVFGRWLEVEKQIADDELALKDPELRELAEAELPELREEKESLEAELQVLLLPKDPNDGRDTLLEIRAGTGGEEAALFAADLFRMYSRYAETKGWKVEITSLSDASAGGIKEVIAMVTGERVYSHLRFEAGVHRVQRIPATESQGRIHTSTATVAVLPEADEVEVQIDEADLQITKTAAGGKGGQGVNTTNSAVNLLHLPTGIMVRSEEQRSQIQNLARAKQILRAKLLERAQAAQAEAIRDERRGMVGTGERSEKIRTYNAPQNRITDHRIGLTVHAYQKVLDGELDELIGALRADYQARLLERETAA
ncbi:MAG: peptide chain release factor 1 [Sandaracinus sp.]|nr:peptide chain release factor 1 [Sandaracinus sp.]MCB9632203.1 peptide chain release factor 1 [Sandaracinus sp.]